ncbi:MAG TPA: site-specific integrase [Myxococcota bacterium]|nr:site-specific integrase [Myxococcota bacterium]
MADLATEYLERHARPKKKPSSAALDEHNLCRHVLPSPLARIRVEAVTERDVARLHHAMSATPVAANRTAALLSKMFSLAEAWKYRPKGSNPVRGLERYRERGRERFLSSEELGRLGDALAAAEAEGIELKGALAAIRLLILTGARRSEILSLQWPHVDLERRCLRLPDSKSGAKSVVLNAPALEALAGLARDRSDSPWVIQGAKPGRPLVNITKPWFRLRTRAGLDGVRLHDLRHNYASIGAAAGMGLYIVGKLLGHTRATTTERYSHLAMDPLREASERIGARIAAALAGKPDADVVPIRVGA